MTIDPLALLWPPPRTARRAGGRLELAGTVALPPDDGLAAARLRRGLGALGLWEDPVGVPIRFHADSPDGGPEAYRLAITGEGIEVTAAGDRGWLRGVGTLLRWLHLHRDDSGRLAPVPALEVEDAPDLAVRGFTLDISRDKVPTMETLRLLVDRLADLELNQLQLYTEHTFAYRGHEEVWRGADPMTPDQARELDRHCREGGIELVPNQNSFGHFHRWLIHDRYRPLAEVPEGFEHPFSERPEPFSLCAVDPRSLELLADLYDQLLPCFASRQLNVGLDETMDLGMGRSKQAVEERGKATVYLEFLHAVHRLVRERGHRMQFWGDIIVQHPERIPELPRDAIALEWGYEAGHPFAEHGARFAASGLDFLVCPGTSSWASLVGRSTNALLNLGEACAQGAAAGAGGALITDWGDFGHLQPLAVSWLGLVAGAGFAWRREAAKRPLEAPIAELLDAWVFEDPAGRMGGAARRLGDAYLHTGTRNFNGSALFYLVAFAGQGLAHPRYRGLSAGGLEQARASIDGALDDLAAAKPGATDGEASRRELAWAGRLAGLGCDLGLALLRVGEEATWSDVPAPERYRLAEVLAPLVAEHEEIWRLRNRAGGRRDSVRRLERTLAILNV